MLSTTQIAVTASEMVTTNLNRKRPLFTAPEISGLGPTSAKNNTAAMITPPATAIDITNPAGLEEEALKNRPEVALAVQQEQLAAATVDAASSLSMVRTSADCSTAASPGGGSPGHSRGTSR